MDILGFHVDKELQVPDLNVKQKPEVMAEEKKEQEGRFPDGSGKRITVYSLCIMTAITVALRLHTIGEPNFVCWDETHFGKFASYYINRTFYWDLHPPLGKMMLGGIGSLTGYDGSYPFLMPGDTYGNHSIVGMRIGCALMGAAVVPMSYLTVQEKTGSWTAALLASAFIAFDTGLAVLTRFILLDPILMFFIFGSTLGDAKFRNEKQVFQKNWWAWLFFTGFMLGCAVSTKHVGLFVVCYVGVSTIQQLWTIMGDSRVSLHQFIKEFSARFLCLIVVPVLVYVLSFYIHFALLHKSGTGDAIFHPEFKALLEGNKYKETVVPKYLSYNKLISLRGNKPTCSFLHSHAINFPKGVGARQQMVTMYANEDENNLFKLKPWVDGLNHSQYQYVRHGDLVRIEHILTGRNVHSHNIPSVVKKNHFQVTGYGWKGEGDANDIWRIEIKDGKSGDLVETFKSEIFFRHYFLGCFLSCSGLGLPKWAYGQNEIVCARWRLEKDPLAPFGCSSWRAYWNSTAFESPTLSKGTVAHNHSQAEDLEHQSPEDAVAGGQSLELDSDTSNISPETAQTTENSMDGLELVRTNQISNSFWFKFQQFHELMVFFNSKIGKKEDGTSSEEQNAPYKWPFNIVAQTYSGSPTPDRLKVWMMGNPTIWAVNLFFVFLLPLIIPWTLIRLSHRLSDEPTERTDEDDRHLEGFLWMVLGWALHYLPFFLMGRALYQHHYYPASVYISMGSAILLDRWTQGLRETLRRVVLGSVLLVFALSYALFSPLVYGMMGDQAKFPNSSYHYLHWTDFWDF